MSRFLLASVALVDARAPAHKFALDAKRLRPAPTFTQTPAALAHAACNLSSSSAWLTLPLSSSSEELSEGHPVTGVSLSGERRAANGKEAEIVVSLFVCLFVCFLPAPVIARCNNRRLAQLKFGQRRELSGKEGST